MKSLLIVSALCCLLMLARANPASTIEEKEDKALQECNATNPVQKNPRIAVASSIATGERLFLTPQEQCVLFCYLQKVNFVDENANIRNGQGLINHTFHRIPEVAKYSDVLIANIFQIKRATQGFENDKCLKAFITYHQYASQVFTLSIAQALQDTTGVRSKVVNYLEKGTPVDQELPNNIKQFLSFIDALFTNFKEEAIKEALKV